MHLNRLDIWLAASETQPMSRMGSIETGLQLLAKLASVSVADVVIATALPTRVEVIDGKLDNAKMVRCHLSSRATIKRDVERVMDINKTTRVVRNRSRHRGHPSVVLQFVCSAR